MSGNKSLDDVLSDLRKKEDIKIGAMDDFDDITPVGLSSGNITFDALTGIGGAPLGRISEFLGPPSSGKTTAALQIAAEVIKNGGHVMFLDYEHSLDPVYCDALGIDVADKSKFLLMQPEYFEQGANAFRKIQSETGGYMDLVIHDSIAAMTTKHELEADTGAVQVADRAKMLYQYCRQLNPALPRWQCAAIFLNHLLEKVDATPMGRQLAARGIKQWTSPGGNGVRFYASLRVEFKQIGNIKTEEMDLLNNESVKQVRQTKSQVTVIKNKVADPFKTAELRVRFGKGFSNPYSVFSLLVAHNVIKKSGAWFTFPFDLALDGDEDNMKLQGEETVLDLIEQNPHWEEVLTARAKQILGMLGQDAITETVDESELDIDLLMGQDGKPEEGTDDED